MLQAEPALTEPTVAFIDDDPSFLEAISDLSEFLGLKHRTTFDPGEALNWATSRLVSSIVSDMRMPGIDTVAFLESIRKANDSIRIVVLTAFSPTSSEQAKLDRLGASVHFKGDGVRELILGLTKGGPVQASVGSTTPPGGHRRPTIPLPTLYSVFMSYGGPDEVVARAIYEALTYCGAEVFFFPESAIPGRRLHRMMSDGVMYHDRIVLLCSRGSLLRPGVLNELEQVLAREAAEGGTELLIPIDLDGFVFSEWCPPRGDLGVQVRNRVIADFRNKSPGTVEFDKAIARIAAALTKR